MMRIGQLVTWPKVRTYFSMVAVCWDHSLKCTTGTPQLHMIENRYRLERQIFLGRQSVRKALQGGSNDRVTARAESMPLGPVPRPATGTQLPGLAVPPLSSLAPTEDPLPMDTDAEALMLNGDGKSSPSPPAPRRRNSRHDLPESSLGRPQPRRRRSGASFGSFRDPDGDYGGGTPDPPPHSGSDDHDGYPVQHERQNSSQQSQSHGGSILRRLSRTSLRAAFNSLRRPNPPTVTSAHSKRASVDLEQTWSGDSSTDDDDLSILSRRRSSRYPSALELQTALQRQLSSDEDDGGPGQVDADG